MLSDAMNDLQEQVKIEHVPAEKNEEGKAVSYTSLPIYLAIRKRGHITFKSPNNI